MRNPVLAAFALLPLLSLAACGKSEQNESQPGMVANIMDQALPGSRDLPPDANSITPVEPAPDLPVAKGDAERANAIPIGLQGRWAGLQERCGDKAAALELRVTAASLVFHESVGTVQRVAHRPDGQLSVDATFTGEGDSWTRTLTLRPSADGQQLTVVNDGTAVVRKRCTPPA